MKRRRRIALRRRLRQLFDRLRPRRCTCDGGFCGPINYGHAPWCEK